MLYFITLECKINNFFYFFIFRNITLTMCNYLLCILVLLDFSKCYIFSKNLYHIPPLTLFALYLFFGKYLKGKSPRKAPEAEKIKENPTNNNSDKKD